MLPRLVSLFVKGHAERVTEKAGQKSLELLNKSTESVRKVIEDPKSLTSSLSLPSTSAVVQDQLK